MVGFDRFLRKHPRLIYLIPVKYKTRSQLFAQLVIILVATCCLISSKRHIYDKFILGAGIR